MQTSDERRSIAAVIPPPARPQVVARLAAAGFLAPEEEADELLGAAADGNALAAMVERRLTGEPLAWITGTTRFCGIAVRVDPGVYVPRPQSEALARRAVARLPARGTAVDLCTGSGAIARVLAVARPDATVLATDVDERAVACARANGVHALRGDLFEPLAADLAGTVDVIVAVVPYVPTREMALLQRDTFTFESPLAYDGGEDGLCLLRRVLRDGRGLLRPGGTVLLELGAGQPELLAPDLATFGYAVVDVLEDEEGLIRGVEAASASS